jgi:hypothetical protein
MKKAMIFGAAALGAAAVRTIYWRTDDGRTGTILPQRGEDWGAMRKFLRQTGAQHVYAYTVDGKGDDHLVYEGRPNRGRRAAHGDAVSARELALYIDNTPSLYGQMQSIRMNLLRKVKKGTYDRAQAPKLWLYLVDNGAKTYAKGYSQSWHGMFPKPTREMVAREYVTEFDTDLRNAGSWEALAEEYGVLGERGLKPTGQRSRKIWLGMQGLPARGRHVDWTAIRTEANDFADSFARDAPNHYKTRQAARRGAGKSFDFIVYMLAKNYGASRTAVAKHLSGLKREMQNMSSDAVAEFYG